MRRYNLLARLFRALSGKTQTVFGEEVGVHPKLLNDYEQGDVEPSAEHLQRLATGVNLTIADGKEILRFADLLRRPRQRSGLGFGGLRERLRTLSSSVYQRVVRLPLPDSAPKAEDRQRAEELWLLLKALPEDQQSAVIRVGREFQIWSLCERFCEESVQAASQDLKRAAELARCAVEIAERVRGPERWRQRVRGYAAAIAANILRVLGELKAAESALAKAEQLWSSGSDPYGLLDPGRLLDLKASLCRDLRRFEEALGWLQEARGVSRCPGRILVSRGFTLEVMGEYERAIKTLHEAEVLVNRKENPRLWYQLQFNLAVNYCHAARFSEAEGLAVQVRDIVNELGDQIFSSRVLWLAGRIAAGLGHREEARVMLEKAQREFSDRKMSYDVALAMLEIAVLLLEEGRSAEVRSLVEGLTEVFDSKGVHREAAMALRLFQEAAEREHATAELTRRVLRFLFRARYDKGLRFTDS